MFDIVNQLGGDITGAFARIANETMGDIMAVLGKGPKLIEGDFSVLLDMANAAITLFERVLKEGAQLVKKLIVAIFDVIKSIWNAEIDLSFISWVIEKVFGFKLTITEL